MDRHNYEPVKPKKIDERQIYEREPTEYVTHKGIGNFNDKGAYAKNISNAAK